MTNGKTSILSRVASADKSAAKECIDLYGAMIWAMAKNFTGSDKDAEQTAQEIFTDIWRNAELSNLSSEDEKLWIALMARRCLSKYAMRH